MLLAARDLSSPEHLREMLVYLVQQASEYNRPIWGVTDMKL
jgi:hypothetical protein